MGGIRNRSSVFRRSSCIFCACARRRLFLRPGLLVVEIHSWVSREVHTYVSTMKRRWDGSMLLYPILLPDLSVCCLPVCWFVRSSACFVCLSFCLYVCLYVFLYVCLSACLSVWLSVCPGFVPQPVWLERPRPPHQRHPGGRYLPPRRVPALRPHSLAEGGEDRGETHPRDKESIPSCRG